MLCVGASLAAPPAAHAADTDPAKNPADWTVLFDGTTLEAWHTYGQGQESPPHWAIEDGVLAWRPKCGNLATREIFGNFELELDWKISPGGNSGVMFRVEESPGAQPYASGPEVQVLDDAGHKDGRSPLTSAGALYALYAPAQPLARPAGVWNHLRIVARGPQLQVWQNGVPVIQAVMGSTDWNERVARSKFSKMPRFGQCARGLIVLQDHGDPVWYRSIRIRRLD